MQVRYKLGYLYKRNLGASWVCRSNPEDQINRKPEDGKMFTNLLQHASSLLTYCNMQPICYPIVVSTVASGMKHWLEQNEQNEQDLL